MRIELAAIESIQKVYVSISIIMLLLDFPVADAEKVVELHCTTWRHSKWIDTMSGKRRNIKTELPKPHPLRMNSSHPPPWKVDRWKVIFTFCFLNDVEKWSE